MSTDDDLSRDLTAVLRGLDGIVDVFDAHPVVESALRGVAADLHLAESTGLVRIERAEGLVWVTAHVGTDIELSTPESLTRASDALRSHLATVSLGHDETMVAVTAHLVDSAR